MDDRSADLQDKVQGAVAAYIDEVRSVRDGVTEGAITAAEADRRVMVADLWLEGTLAAAAAGVSVLGVYTHL